MYPCLKCKFHYFILHTIYFVSLVKLNILYGKRNLQKYLTSSFEICFVFLRQKPKVILLFFYTGVILNDTFSYTEGHISAAHKY